MAEGDRAQHDLFRELLGLGLHHQHGVLRAGDDQVELTGLELAGDRVQQIIAVGITDTHAADGPGNRPARQRKRGRGAKHGRNIGIDLGIDRHDGSDYLDLVIEALGKQRAQRPIDQATG